jgi:L-lactate dehydrogenase
VPSSRVLGSGTTLDTARFRALLSQHLGVDAFHVHGYVVGEHGDSEVLTWSLVTVAGFPLDEFCEQRGICLDELQRREMDDQVRMAAYAIIRGKDATYYGIGAALSRIVDVILRDQRSILTVTTPAADVAGVPDVSVSMPRLLGGSGIIETFPLPLDSGEQAKLHDSALVVRRAIEGLDAA